MQQEIEQLQSMNKVVRQAGYEIPILKKRINELNLTTIQQQHELLDQKLVLQKFQIANVGLAEALHSSIRKLRNYENRFVF